MAIKYNGITLENIKYGNTQLDKVIFNNTVVYESYNKAYDKTTSASSNSHYGVDIYADSTVLANTKISKVIVETYGRSLTGDGTLDLNVTTSDGTNIYKSNGTYHYGSGTADGTSYTLVGTQPGDGHSLVTLTFAKPIFLKSVRGWCGSGAGQWRENDTIYLRLVGYSK